MRYATPREYFKRLEELREGGKEGGLPIVRYVEEEDDVCSNINCPPSLPPSLSLFLPTEALLFFPLLPTGRRMEGTDREEEVPGLAFTQATLK